MSPQVGTWRRPITPGHQALLICRSDFWGKVPAMNTSPWRLGWRTLWRDLRSGELRLLIVAVTLAVAALTAVGFFADRLKGGLQRDARQLLGGDAVVTSDNPTPQAFIDQARRLWACRPPTRSLSHHGRARMTAAGRRQQAGGAQGGGPRVTRCAAASRWRTAPETPGQTHPRRAGTGRGLGRCAAAGRRWAWKMGDPSAAG
jgi:hypothetical protein